MRITDYFVQYFNKALPFIKKYQQTIIIVSAILIAAAVFFKLSQKGSGGVGGGVSGGVGRGVGGGVGGGVPERDVHESMSTQPRLVAQHSCTVSKMRSECVLC